MRRRSGLITLLALVFILAVPGGASASRGGARSPATTPPGTAFTYHGQLQSDGTSVDGSCAMAFRLYDAASAGAQVGAAITTTVAVAGGQFSVPLDFGGGVFSGQALWLDIQVMCGADPGFTVLSPRPPLTAAPYALALPGLRTEPNTISPNIIGGSISNSVGGGLVGATIGGGGRDSLPNRVSANFGSVAGGLANTASGALGSVGGGRGNLASGDDATVAGGLDNTASGAGATVGGGGWDGANDSGNQAAGGASTIAGGLGNVISPTASYGTISGGRGNTVSGQYATVAGGHNNSATAAGSFAAGQNARADEAGSFVWDDGTSPVAATGPNTFNAVATGGFFFYAGKGDCSLTDGTGWMCFSDRNLKENFTPLDTRALLAALARLPLTAWNVKGSAVRHIGPVAQDFYAAFNVGADNRHINTVDEQGVALAALQGLDLVVQDQAAKINAQQAQLDDLQTRLAALERRPAESAAPAAANPDPIPLWGWLAFGGLLLLNLGGLLGYLIARGRRAAGSPA